MTAEQDFVKIKTAYDQREQFKQQAEELEKLLRLNDLKQTIINLEDRVKKGEGVIEKTIFVIGQLKKEKEKLEIRLREEKAKQPDMLVLLNAKSWHELNKNLRQQFVSIGLEEQKFRDGIRVTDHSINKMFEAELFSNFSGDKNTKTGNEFLKQKVTELKTQVSGFESEIQHFKVQLKLQEYAVSLKEGEACPICGSLHHPEILSVANVSESLNKLIARKTAVEKEITNCELQILGLTELQHSRNISEQQLAGIQNRQKDLEEKIAAHQLLFKWTDFRNEEDVIQAFKLAESLKKSISELEKLQESTSKKLDQEAENKEKYILNIEMFKTELTASRTELNTLNAQIKLIDLNAYSGKTKAEILLEKDSLLQKYNEIEKQYTSLNNQLVKHRKNKDILSGSITANQIQLEQEKKSEEEIKLQLETELNKSAYEDADAVKLILKQQLNLEAEKQKVNNFRQEISLTRNQQEVLTKEVGERKYDPEIHRDLRSQLERNNELLGRQNKEYGVIEKSLTDLRKAIETQKDLRDAYEKLELRADNIKTMKSLFTASGFVNYISSVYLQNLCNAANDRFFQLTRQKLSLEITDDNNFQVRDFLNGGKVRSVKTLSGGQTFQAALSLALALADNIQKITESNQNFFFLDEGFGSLDKDSLSVVFDALKSLRKENRIVGVISHVEEMQQEIDVHLRILNEDEKGSRIFASWGN